MESSGVPIIPEQWTHLAATFNRTSIEIYVNGKLESSLAITGIPTLSVRGGLTTKTVDTISSDADIIIGAYLNTVRSTSSNLFSGSIQDVKLYDSLLSPSQIANLYENNEHAHLDINTIPINATFSDNIKITDDVIAHLYSTTTNATSPIPINATSLSDNIKITDGITLYVNFTQDDYTIPTNSTLYAPINATFSDNIAITDDVIAHLYSTTTNATSPIPINATFSDNIKITDGITLYVNSTQADYTIPTNSTLYAPINATFSDNIKITDDVIAHLYS